MLVGKEIAVLVNAYSALAFSYARCSTKQAGAVDSYNLIREELKDAAQDN